MRSDPAEGEFVDDKDSAAPATFAGQVWRQSGRAKSAAATFNSG